MIYKTRVKRHTWLDCYTGPIRLYPRWREKLKKKDKKWREISKLIYQTF